MTARDAYEDIVVVALSKFRSFNLSWLFAVWTAMIAEWRVECMCLSSSVEDDHVYCPCCGYFAALNLLTAFD